MTTIAYRAGVMASDTRAYSGDKHPIGTKQKVFRMEDGTLVGVSSSIVGTPTAFMNWFRGIPANMDLSEVVADTEHMVQALVVKPDGSAFYWNDSRAFSGPLEGEFFAIGSGQYSALAAMICGKDAVGAIEVAIEVDPWTGGQVRTVRHA